MAEEDEPIWWQAVLVTGWLVVGALTVWVLVTTFAG